MARTRHPLLSFGIVMTLGIISLCSIGGVIACALSAHDNQITSAALAALVSIASGSAGAISSFLVNPAKGLLGADDE